MILPLVLAAVFVACETSAPPTPSLPVVAAGFVGDGACASCHEQEYSSFQNHGMANSFYRMTPERVIEDFHAGPVFHEEDGFYYRAYRNGERFYQEEYRLDDEGNRTHHLVWEVTHVVGSAQAARTYVSEKNERYYEMPLTWYAQEGIWDFTPGYRAANRRFDRKLTSRCMACHTDAPPRVAGTDDVFERTPAAISCERCHGPAQEHVAARRAVPEPAEEIDPTIVNPAHLDLERRLDVCQQCHLNGAVVMYPDGKDPYSFRPGDRLEDQQLMYVLAHDSGIDVISHADRMKQSACFIATQGTPLALECTTCHDPHTGFRDSGPAFFNDTCQGCHEDVQAQVAEPSHDPSTNCIDCHMVRSEVDNAPHSTFTDHYIRAHPAAVEAPHESSEPVILEPLYGEGSEAELARAYLTYGWSRGEQDQIQRGLALSDRAADAFLEPGNSNAALVLGKSRLLAGRPAEAVEMLQAAVDADTTDAERLHNIARALQEMGDAESAEVFYRRALTKGPRSAAILSDFGRFLQREGSLVEAEQMYRRAIAEEPTSAAFHNGLAAVLGSGRRYREAVESAEEAVRLDPDFVDGLTNLGTFLARLGEQDRALEILDQAAALGMQEGNLTPVLNLGLVSLDAGRHDEGIFMIGQVVQANPDNPDLRVLLARAFVGTGDSISALAQVNAALRAVPGHEEAAAMKARLESSNQ